MNFRELTLWKEAMTLAGQCFLLVEHLPQKMQANLGNQLQQSSVALPSKVAEACGHEIRNEMIKILYQAQGVAYQLETQLILVKELKIANVKIDDLIRRVIGIQQVITAFQKSLA